MKRYVFDLDNTLIFTDSLNNDSYNYALSKLGLALINECKRLTRDIVFSSYPSLNIKQKSEIIELKQKYFVTNLERTFPNQTLLKFLLTKNVESCMLWTSADETRVLSILKYYNIETAFKKILLSKKVQVKQDIEEICELIECNPEKLIFFEDNKRVIYELQQLKMTVIAVDSYKLGVKDTLKNSNSS